MAGVGDKSALLDVVKEDSDMLKDIIREFTEVAIKFDIQLYCFYEQSATNIAAVVLPRFLGFLRYPVRNPRQRPYA